MMFLEGRLEDDSKDSRLDRPEDITINSDHIESYKWLRNDERKTYNENGDVRNITIYKITMSSGKEYTMSFLFLLDIVLKSIYEKHY